MFKSPCTSLDFSNGLFKMALMTLPFLQDIVMSLKQDSDTQVPRWLEDSPNRLNGFAQQPCGHCKTFLVLQSANHDVNCFHIMSWTFHPFYFFPVGVLKQRLSSDVSMFWCVTLCYTNKPPSCLASEAWLFQAGAKVPCKLRSLQSRYFYFNGFCRKCCNPCSIFW